MELKKSFKLLDIFFIASGAMISSGLFVLPSIVYKYAGPSILLSYLLAGLFLIPAMFSKAELASAMPKSGGSYFFIERSLGYFFGIFTGFADWFSIGLKSAFALIGIGAFLEYITGYVDYFQIKLVAGIICVVFIIFNIVSIKTTINLQKYFVIFLLAVLFVYIGWGLRKVNTTHFYPFLPPNFKSIFTVSAMVFVSYAGLTKVVSISEEIKEAHRIIPWGMFLSFMLVQVIYLGAIFVTIGILSPSEILNTLTPLTHGAIKLGGNIWGVLLSLAAISAFVTTANAGLLSSSRVPFAMAKDNLLPPFFSKISSKHGTPYVAILWTGIFMLSLILFLDLENLVKVASTLLLILFILESIAVIVMRESKVVNYRPTFKTLFYPIPQIFVILFYGFLIWEMGFFALNVSVGFVLLSMLIYYLYVKRRLKRQAAIVHLLERVTSKDLVDTSLEEELRKIVKERDKLGKDRFDELVEKSFVLDLKERISKDEFFDIISTIFSSRVGLRKEDIKELFMRREEESSTVVDKELAIPHVVTQGEGKFDMIIVRAKKGIVFSPKNLVKVAFVLIGSADQRNFHLRTLMAIAQTVREFNFYHNFMRAKNEANIKLLILSSSRKREVIW